MGTSPRAIMRHYDLSDDFFRVLGWDRRWCTCAAGGTLQSPP